MSAARFSATLTYAGCRWSCVGTADTDGTDIAASLMTALSVSAEQARGSVTRRARRRSPATMMWRACTVWSALPPRPAASGGDGRRRIYQVGTQLVHVPEVLTGPQQAFCA